MRQWRLCCWAVADLSLVAAGLQFAVIVGSAGRGILRNVGGDRGELVVCGHSKKNRA